MDSDEEKPVDLPPIRVRNSELSPKFMKDILLSMSTIYHNFLELEELFKKYTLDKDVCVELVKHVKTNPEYKKSISIFFIK